MGEEGGGPWAVDGEGGEAEADALKGQGAVGEDGVGGVGEVDGHRERPVHHTHRGTLHSARPEDDAVRMGCSMVTWM